MPDIIELTLSEAKSKLSQAGIEYEVLGYGGDVVGQYPKAGDEIANFERAFIVLEKVDDANESLKVEVPSLWGMGSVEADKALAEVGLYIKIKGVGSEVTDQYPWEGESAYVGDVVTVTFGYPPKDEQQTE
jgi:penicillin-binding protein 2B